MDEQLSQLISAATLGDLEAVKSLMQYVAEAMQGDLEKAQAVQSAMQNGDDQTKQILQACAQQIQAYYQQLQGLAKAQMARFGAKLNYIRQLKGACPPGTETEYFKSGGRICKKCKQKMQEGKKFADALEEYKCGSKMKNKIRKGEGGLNSEDLYKLANTYRMLRGMRTPGWYGELANTGALLGSVFPPELLEYPENSDWLKQVTLLAAAPMGLSTLARPARVPGRYEHYIIPPISNIPKIKKK